jgi:hypothetical protein
MSADVVRVPSLGSPHRVLHRSAMSAAIALALAAGGFGVRDLKAQTVRAEAAQAEPPRVAPAWCLQRNESADPPICAYDSFPSCFIAGFKEGGYCIANPGPAAATVPSADQAARRRVARSAPPQPQNGVGPAPNGQPTAQAPRKRQLTAAEREKIFNDFQRWREQRGEPKSEQRASTKSQQ